MKRRFTWLLAILLARTLHAQVLPNDAVVGGLTIGEWSAEWFRSFYPQDRAVSPMFDPDGRSATNGQPDGPVFFLGSGTGFETGPIVRAFSVPDDKYLLMPLLVATVDNIDIYPPLTIEEMRDGIRAFTDNPRELHASLDGVEVPDLIDHRAETPVFSIEYTDADNYLSAVYGKPIEGLVDPVIGNGYWLMIAPLAPGVHVLRYGGAFPNPFYFPTDITATITVVRTPLDHRVAALLGAVESATLPERRKRPLLATLSAARTAFEEDRVQAGIHLLGAFQHQVRAQIAPTDYELAAKLISAAEAIRARAAGKLGD